MVANELEGNTHKRFLAFHHAVHHLQEIGFECKLKIRSPCVASCARSEETAHDPYIRSVGMRSSNIDIQGQLILKQPAVVPPSLLPGLLPQKLGCFRANPQLCLSQRGRPV